MTRKKKGKKSDLVGFFEDEAELGSDDENNDAIKKEINKNDVEENEEGLDSDLEGFIDHTKYGRGEEVMNLDEDEIEDLEDGARQKFL